MVYRSLASLPYRSLYSLVSHAQSCINTAFLSNGHHCSELCSSTRFFKQAKAAAHKKGSAYSTIKKPRTFYTLRDAALAIIIIEILFSSGCSLFRGCVHLNANSGRRIIGHCIAEDFQNLGSYLFGDPCVFCRSGILGVTFNWLNNRSCPIL
jgi:hypothetical protein